MDEQFQEITNYISQWIDNGEYKEANPTFDRDTGLTIVDFVADYFLPSPDQEDEEEFNTTEILLTVYINEKNQFKLDFNKPLFDWYFKGYETEENISVVEKFMEYAEKIGLRMSF